MGSPITEWSVLFTELKRSLHTVPRGPVPGFLFHGSVWLLEFRPVHLTSGTASPCPLFFIRKLPSALLVHFCLPQRDVHTPSASRAALLAGRIDAFRTLL